MSWLKVASLNPTAPPFCNSSPQLVCSVWAGWGAFTLWVQPHTQRTVLFFVVLDFIYMISYRMHPFTTGF